MTDLELLTSVLIFIGSGAIVGSFMFISELKKRRWTPEEKQSVIELIQTAEEIRVENLDLKATIESHKSLIESLNKDILEKEEKIQQLKRSILLEIQP